MKGKVVSGLSESQNSLSLSLGSSKFCSPGSLLAEPPDVHELKLLQEFEHQVPEFDPQGLIIVTDDVGGVLLQLDQGLSLLQQHNVALGRVLHLDIAESVLGLGRERERGNQQSSGKLGQRRDQAQG